jgi:hypothetical protein
MGYLHIDNLYKNQLVLMFRECYALEKIHGTSAHVAFHDGNLTFSAGGEKHERFIGLFDSDAIKSAFEALGHTKVAIYGEAYGGKQQAQAWRYGQNLRFVAFDVRVGDHWLAVPNAEDVAKKVGIEFVHYAKIPTTLDAIDAERDAPSEQARRNGVSGDKPREGVVLRPLLEFVLNSSDRIIAKHKRDDERETKTPRKVVDPAMLEVLTAAASIADEWVTPARLEHVLQKLGPEGTIGIEQSRDVISNMIMDVLREANAEIVDSREARQAIGRKTVELFKTRLKSTLSLAR